MVVVVVVVTNNFVLYDQVLEKEAFPTFFGVTFDAQLTFKKHGEQNDKKLK